MCNCGGRRASSRRWIGQRSNVSESMEEGGAPRTKQIAIRLHVRIAKTNFGEFALVVEPHFAKIGGMPTAVNQGWELVRLIPRMSIKRFAPFSHCNIVTSSAPRYLASTQCHWLSLDHSKRRSWFSTGSPSSSNTELLVTQPAPGLTSICLNVPRTKNALTKAACEVNNR